jgi:hypothetical protein
MMTECVLLKVYAFRSAATYLSRFCSNFAKAPNYARSELSSGKFFSGSCSEGVPALQGMRGQGEEAPLQDGR